MTNLEFIRTLNAEDFVTYVFNKSNYMCLQRGKYDNEIWQQHCLGKYGGGNLLACEQCRADWLNANVGTIEKELLENARKRVNEKLED